MRPTSFPRPRLLAILSLCSLASTTYGAFPRSAPEAEGVSSSGILDFVEAADAKIDTMNSFMLVRHGKVVAEGWWTPYDAETPHVLYSLTKSFTSTAVGLAIADKKLSLDDTLISLFPEQAPANPSANLKAMRVRDLLRMSTGHHADDVAKFAPGPQDNRVQAFLALPVAHKPGTHFWYNSPGSDMLSEAVQKATGQTEFAFLTPRLFEPLGIKNPLWKLTPQGVNFGSYGLNLRTEEIAKFGQLYLQKGQWEGHQLVPADWVAQATARQTANGSDPTSDWDQGYGYQFWQCRHGFYRGDGAFGQFCFVLPEYDAVIAITSGSRTMQAVMDLVWDHLVPALKAKTLAADKASDEKLKKRLSSLSVRVVNASAGVTPTPEFLNKTFALPDNDQGFEKLALSPGENGDTVLTLRVKGADEKIVCGKGHWTKGRMKAGTLDSRYLGIPDELIAASGAWTAADTYTAKIVFYQTPIYLTLEMKMGQKDVSLKRNYSVVMKVTSEPDLVGHIE